MAAPNLNVDVNALVDGLNTIHAGIGAIIPLVHPLVNLNANGAMNHEILEAVRDMLQTLDVMSLQQIRVLNRRAAMNAPINYPARTPPHVLEQLPVLKEQATDLDGDQAANALGLLGQPAPPNDMPAEQKRNLLLTFLGIM